MDGIVMRLCVCFGIDAYHRHCGARACVCFFSSFDIYLFWRFSSCVLEHQFYLQSLICDVFRLQCHYIGLIDRYTHLIDPSK